jgi:hypothetical protein
VVEGVDPRGDVEKEWWIPVYALCDGAETGTGDEDLLARCRVGLSGDVQKMLGYGAEEGEVG